MHETFSSLLQEIMYRNNLTQRELARRAEIDHVSLCRMLKPSYRFKPGKTIDRLTKAVGCTESERMRLYRVAGLMPEEMLEAFCKDDLAADSFYRATQSYTRHKRLNKFTRSAV